MTNPSSDDVGAWQLDPTTRLWVVDTRRTAMRLSLDLWRDSLEKDLSPAKVVALDGRAFAGRLIAVGDPAYTTFGLEASPSALVRAEAEVRRGAADVVLVVTVDDGTIAIEQRGRTLLAGPGNVLVVFADVPFRISHLGTVSASGVRLPASSFPAALRDRSPLLLDHRTTATAALVAAHLRWQPEDVSDFLSMRDLVKDHLAALLRHALREVLRPEVQSATLGDAIRAIVEAEIANPDLSAKLICARLGVSRTTLFEAVAAMGESLGSLVRERRLLACLRDMRAGRPDTVAAISERWGFREQSTFTRAFRRRFGQPPTQWRRIAPNDEPPDEPTGTAISARPGGAGRMTFAISPREDSDGDRERGSPAQPHSPRRWRGGG